LIKSLDHVLMFVPSVRTAAEWYSSAGVCRFADPFGNLIGLIGAYHNCQAENVAWD